jgi:hypothetical protein
VVGNEAVQDGVEHKVFRSADPGVPCDALCAVEYVSQPVHDGIRGDHRHRADRDLLRIGREQHMAEGKAAATSGDNRAQQPGPPRTLMQAHEALVRIRPKGDASPTVEEARYRINVRFYY